MNAALASLFNYLDQEESKQPEYQSGTNKQQVFDAMVKLARPCCVSDLMEETGLNTNQVQYALRHMKDHGVIDIKEIARGAGRTFMYNIAPKLGRPAGIMPRIVALLDNGEVALNARDIAKQLGASVGTIKTTLGHAIKTQNSPGVTREMIGGLWYYKASKE